MLRLFCVALCCAATMACSDKKQSTNIIAPKPQPVKKKATQTMSEYRQAIPVEWLGTTYDVNVERHADHSLPLADDGAGNKYYDNKIKLSIVRRDKSVFFSRTFTKSDFDGYVDEIYRKNSALLGVIFDKAEGNHLVFAVSVGSPDKMSDEYVPLVMKISNLGAVSVSKDTKMDTGSEDSGMSELDMAEEDGM